MLLIRLVGGSVIDTFFKIRMKQPVLESWRKKRGRYSRYRTFVHLVFLKNLNEERLLSIGPFLIFFLLCSCIETIDAPGRMWAMTRTPQEIRAPGPRHQVHWRLSAVFIWDDLNLALVHMQSAFNVHVRLRNVGRVAEAFSNGGRIIRSLEENRIVGVLKKNQLCKSYLSFWKKKCFFITVNKLTDVK